VSRPIASKKEAKIRGIEKTEHSDKTRAKQCLLISF
jgi:hypothetical protein